MTKIALLLIALLSMAFIDVFPLFFVQGNPLQPQKIDVILLSPENRSYSKESIPLNFRISHWQDLNIEAWFTIDDQAPMKLYLNHYLGSLGTSEHNSVILNLKEGSHVIKVWAESSDSYSEGQVFFTIDKTAPTVNIISIENRTYTETNLELNCTTNEPYSWMAYCLDNQANATIKTMPYYVYTFGNRNNKNTQANTTLTSLPQGSHSITIYANDTAGNMGTSQTITFTVDKTEPFPTAHILIIAIATTIAVTAVFLLTHRRHQRKSNNTSLKQQIT